MTRNRFDLILEILTILAAALFTGLVIMKYADRTWLPLTPSTTVPVVEQGRI